MKPTKSVIGIGLFTAIASSLCCIAPLLAVLAGTTSFATTFQWVEPLQPYLIGLTIAALGFAWYQQFKPVVQDDCGCEVPKTSFFQGKSFLGIVTVFAALMLAFPLYSKSLFPTQERQTISVAEESQLQTAEFEVIGMTCGGCEAHVEHAVGELQGIVDVKASYENEKAIVKFDGSQTTIEEITVAIKSTDYKVEQFKILKTWNDERNR